MRMSALSLPIHLFRSVCAVRPRDGRWRTVASLIPLSVCGFVPLVARRACAATASARAMRMQLRVRGVRIQRRCGGVCVARRSTVDGGAVRARCTVDGTAG